MKEPIILAGGVIRNEANNILLLHRNTPRLVQWEMPGGKLNEGEKPEEAMVRELKEELNVDVTMARWLGQKPFYQGGIEYQYHWFLTEVINMPRIMEPQTFDELHYFPEHRLRRMTEVLSPNMQQFSKQLNDGEIRLET